MIMGAARNMVDIEAGVLTFRKLLEMGEILFSIPSYQRGYRWREENIRALLEDLKEFSEGMQPLYCLQPVVLQRTTLNIAGKNEQVYRIVDGQQRLTTITILLKCLGVPVPWDMFYETVGGDKIPENGRKLSALLEGTDEGINGYFRRSARDCIRTWLAENENGETILSRALGVPDDDVDSQKDVAVIVYFIEEGVDNVHELFNKLNDGRVPLTSAELIKALYEVDANGLEPSEKLEIAKEWEMIERGLHDESFWRIFIKKGAKIPFTRIEELFAVVANSSEKDRRVIPLAVFHDVETRLQCHRGREQKRRKSGDMSRAEVLKAVWKEVVELYWWMRSCAEDIEISNYLGWLSLFSDNQLKTLYELYKCGKRLPESDSLVVPNELKGKAPNVRERREGRMECFKKNIMAYIANHIQDRFQDVNVRDGLSEVKYDDTERDRTPLRELFVLLNVCLCNIAGEHFRFDHYLEEYEDPSEKTMDEGLSGNKRKRVGWHVDHIHLHCEGQTVSENGYDVNGIWNLTLIDGKTNNRGEFKIAGDESFASKRQVVRKLMNGEEGRYYILPLSQRVYMKFYSGDNGAKGNTWEYDSDGKPYETALSELLKSFFSQVDGK